LNEIVMVCMQNKFITGGLLFFILILLSGCSSVIQENDENLIKFSCIGSNPLNSSLCEGDDLNLIENETISVSESCTDSKKCEYVCDLDSILVEKFCIKKESEFDSNETIKKFDCVNNLLVANSIICEGDNLGLKEETQTKLVSICTSENKCEYICKKGYEKDKNECLIPFTDFLCKGNISSHAQLCKDDNRGLLVDTNASLVSFCTSTNKCEYICINGYAKEGNSCVKSTGSNYSCTGVIFENSVICEGDDSDLKWSTSSELVSECTSSKKCEYLCASGYENKAGVCTKILSTDTCKVITTINLVGSVVAIASSKDINSAISPQNEKAQYFVIFDNNVFKENAFNPFATSSGDVSKNVTDWLSEKGVKKVVVSSVNGGFASSLDQKNLECFQTTGMIRVIIGWGLLKGDNPNNPY